MNYSVCLKLANKYKVSALFVNSLAIPLAKRELTDEELEAELEQRIKAWLAYKEEKPQ